MQGQNTLRQRLGNFFSTKSNIVSTIAALLGILILGAGVFLYSNKPNIERKNDNTTVLITIAQLGDGAPLSLVRDDAVFTNIFNKQEAEVEPGKYVVKVLIDGKGGIEEMIDVKDKQKNEFNFSLNNAFQPSREQEKSSSGLPLDQYKVAATNDAKSSLQSALISVKQSSNDAQSKAVQLLLPVASNQLLTSNQILLQPATVFNTAVLKTNVSENTTTNTIGDEAQSDQEIIDGESKNASQSLTIVASENPKKEPEVIVKDCSIFTASMSADGSAVRYFKVCPDSGQNGFYAYNIATKTETKLLATSQQVNMIRTAIDPNSNTMVFTKETGDFGIVQNGQAEIIKRNTRLSAPFFSPDGKYLMLVESIGSTENANANLYQSFGLKVVAVDWQDLLTNKQNALFNELGTSYYVPRPDDYSFKFWEFQNNNTTFRVGDSPKVFNIEQGEKANNEDKGQIPGRIYTGKNHIIYRVDQGYLFDADNKIIAQGVNQVIESGENVYFVIGDYLYRISDSSELIQAYPNKLIALLHSGNALMLVDDQGNLERYEF